MAYLETLQWLLVLRAQFQRVPDHSCESFHHVAASDGLGDVMTTVTQTDHAMEETG